MVLTQSEHSQRGIIVGVDIGGTKTALMVWDLATEQVLARAAVGTPTEIGPHEFVEGLSEEIAAAIA